MLNSTGQAFCLVEKSISTIASPSQGVDRFVDGLLCDISLTTPDGVQISLSQGLRTAVHPVSFDAF
eukprot:6127146-Amphidinium_carterae.1